MRLNPYLNFGGNCQEALEFYQEHLGGKIQAMMYHNQAPDSSMMPPGQEDKVLYALITFGEWQLMASDAPSSTFQPSRSVYLSFSVDSIEEAERVHQVLAEGGEVFMPMTETFFAFRFSMLRDRFGTLWMVINERPMPSA
jgi:PhnB protein